MTFDYSGIEMRIMAHFSQDPRMLENFAKGVDQHTWTASQIWGIPMDQVDPRTQRFPAKTMGFLIIYGGGPYTLRANLAKAGLDWPLDRCDELIAQYLDLHHGVRDFMKAQALSCRRLGLARTLLGRIRYLPGIHSPNEHVQREAERQAINHPIQGTAQEVIKRAMARIHHALDWDLLNQKGKDELTPVWPLLQVHDEILFEVHEDWAGALGELVPMEMVQAGQDLGLSVPLTVDQGLGDSWDELK